MYLPTLFLPGLALMPHPAEPTEPPSALCNVAWRMYGGDMFQSTRPPHPAHPQTGAYPPPFTAPSACPLPPHPPPPAPQKSFGTPRQWQRFTGASKTPGSRGKAWVSLPPRRRWRANRTSRRRFEKGREGAPCRAVAAAVKRLCGDRVVRTQQNCCGVTQETWSG